MKLLKMRNIIKITAIGIFLFIGSVNVQAQGLSVADNRPEVIAKKQVSMISEQIELSGDQQRTLFRAYVKKEVGYKKYITGKPSNDAEALKQKKLLDQELEATVKKELSSDQFEKWKKTFTK